MMLTKLRNRISGLLLIASLISVGGCDIRVGLINTTDAALDSDATPPDGRSSCGPTDTDGDGIPTEIEGTNDRDEDGLGNNVDTDSDGDGIGDAAEVGSDPCSPTDTDNDGVYDFLDFDSDDDGLRDEHEAGFGTDPTNDDTDGDGHSDGVERALGTSGSDPESLVAEASPILVSGSGTVAAPMRVRHERVDIAFVVEATRQARSSTLRLAESLTRRLTDVQALGDEVRVAAIAYSDYPTPPFGAADDRPVMRLLQMTPADADGFGVPAPIAECPTLDYPTSDQYGLLPEAPNGVSDIVDALRTLPCFDGGDPEGSQAVAISTVASTTFLSWQEPDGSPTGTTRISAWSGSCDAPPGMRVGGPPIGITCMRDDALRVVALVGHSAFHNLDAGYPESGISPEVLSTILSLMHIRAVAVTVGPSPDLADYSNLAMATGAVDRAGTPLAQHVGPDADPTPALLAQLRLLVDETEVILAGARLAASSLTLVGAEDGQGFVAEGSLDTSDLGSQRPGDIVSREFSVRLPAEVTLGRFPVPYTLDLTASLSDTPAITARSRIAIVVAAQQERP